MRYGFDLSGKRFPGLRIETGAPRESGGGDSLDQVGLFGIVFCADGEGVEYAGAESKTDGFILAFAHGALTQDLHPDNSLPLGSHFFDDSDDCLRVGVHVRADGIETDEIDIDPGRSGRCAERFDAVARDAVRANDSLLLGL